MSDQKPTRGIRATVSGETAIKIVPRKNGHAWVFDMVHPNTRKFEREVDARVSAAQSAQ